MSPSPASVAADVASGRGPAREQAICAAVMELLTEMAFDDITVDAVAAKAKASKATIYRRWPNKDALVIDVLHREFLADGIAPEDTGSLRGDLLATLIRDIGDPVRAQHKSAAIRSMSMAVSTAPDLVATMMAELHRTQLRLWSILLERAVARGEISPGSPPELAVSVLRGQLSAQCLFGSGSITPEFLEHLIDDIVLPVVFHAAGRAHRDVEVEGPPMF